MEYAGPVVRALSQEARFSVCNLAVEMASPTGMVSPDDTTFEYLAGREFAPAERYWDQAVAFWRTLPTDDDAVFDREETIDMTGVEPQVTWGINPEHAIGIGERIPDPDQAPASKRDNYRQAIEYSRLTPGEPILGTPVDEVFIGSCVESRISDLRAAAAIVEGRRVASTVSSRTRTATTSAGRDGTRTPFWRARPPSPPRPSPAASPTCAPSCRSRRRRTARTPGGLVGRQAEPEATIGGRERARSMGQEIQRGGHAFDVHEGLAAPFMFDNVSTDVIAPALTNLTDGLDAPRGGPGSNRGATAFANIRYNADGSPKRDFVFNQEAYRTASIMVVGKNYATGSSRVTGVTRPLTAWGVRVYIGESFGPIFLTNAVQYGVLTIELPGRR